MTPGAAYFGRDDPWNHRDPDTGKPYDEEEEVLATDDTVQDIRTLLERHGYRDTGRPYSDRAICGIRRVGGPSLQSWTQALCVFLNDRSETGARIRDIHLASIPDQPNTIMSELFKACHTDNPDDAITALWLGVHELPDPRKEAIQ